MPFLKFTHPVEAQNAAARSAFYRETLVHGILLHPRHLWFVSYSHTLSDIERTLAAADAGFAAAQKALDRS